MRWMKSIKWKHFFPKLYSDESHTLYITRMLKSMLINFWRCISNFNSSMAKPSGVWMWKNLLSSDHLIQLKRQNGIGKKSPIHYFFSIFFHFFPFVFIHLWPKSIFNWWFDTIEHVHRLPAIYLFCICFFFAFVFTSKNLCHTYRSAEAHIFTCRGSERRISRFMMMNADECTSEHTLQSSAQSVRFMGDSASDELSWI